MSGKFRIERATAEQAFSIWRDSPQASAFNHPRLLSVLCEKVTWWAAWKSEFLVSVLPICRTIDGELRPPIFTYYVGPLFNKEIHNFKQHRFWAVRHGALQALLEKLTGTYPSFRFALPAGFTDVRAFQWWNHDHADLGHFYIDPRQTARIDSLQIKEIKEIWWGFARNRRRDIKSVQVNPPESTTKWTVEELLALHDWPLKTQGVDIPASRRSTLARLIEQAANGKGKILAYRRKQSEGLASCLVLLYGREDANGIICGSHPRERDTGLTSWTIWQGLQQARNDGLNIFDFNGANSPNRAASKHSFGSHEQIYFNIDFRKHSSG